MLGAVRDHAAEGIPLFRVLARRWKPLAPVTRHALSSGARDERVKRAWIGMPRRRYAFETGAKKAWNPWLWMK